MADSLETIPTAQGPRRYPTTAGYNNELASPIPCVCLDGCHARCAGECGCEACSAQFSIFCDVAGYHDAVPTSVEEARALAAYRGL